MSKITLSPYEIRCLDSSGLSWNIKEPYLWLKGNHEYLTDEFVIKIFLSNTLVSGLQMAVASFKIEWYVDFAIKHLAESVDFDQVVSDAMEIQEKLEILYANIAVPSPTYGWQDHVYSDIIHTINIYNNVTALHHMRKLRRL